MNSLKYNGPYILINFNLKTILIVFSLFFLLLLLLLQSFSIASIIFFIESNRASFGCFNDENSYFPEWNQKKFSSSKKCSFNMNKKKCMHANLKSIEQQKKVREREGSSIAFVCSIYIYIYTITILCLKLLLLF